MSWCSWSCHYWFARFQIILWIVFFKVAPERGFQARGNISNSCNTKLHVDTGADPGFGQGGGPQLLRPKVADIAKRSHASEASILRPGSRARLRTLEAFGFLMLKYAFSHILETLFLLFLTSILTPKVDKNRALDFTSINLRHSDMLHLFFNLHEKVML